MIDYLSWSINIIMELRTGRHCVFMLHVHLVFISKLVNSLKGVSSRRLRVDYADAIDKIYWKGVLWSPSYFACLVGGAPLSILKQYIEQQERPV